MKIFTLEEAKKLLPIVKTIVTETVEKYALLKELTILSETQSKKGLTKKISALKDEINEVIGHIKILGVELKGLEPGLVDFPSERDGKIIYLCWQVGEESITHWHDVESGFAGRQRL